MICESTSKEHIQITKYGTVKIFQMFPILQLRKKMQEISNEEANAITKWRKRLEGQFKQIPECHYLKKTKKKSI